ncbi:MAG: VCBS repeat-containing protein [Oligoflexales bacterium]|nr:VCBS repeat-containing protein [Oligoflexales bacterium]
MATKRFSIKRFMTVGMTAMSLSILSASSLYGDVTFERITIDKKANGPAFSKLADLNLDGQEELIVSKFGKIGMRVPPGEVTIYKKGSSLSEWEKIPLVTKADGIRFPNKPVVHDVTKNGRPDIIIPSGFLVCEVLPFGKPCGGLTLFENTGEGFKKHDIIKPSYYLFFHGAQFIDLTGDGIEDLITVGERKGGPLGRTKDTAITMWFKGIPEPPYFESKPRVLANGLGALPTLIDLNNDGLLDIASAEYFYGDAASFAWLEQVAPLSAENPNGLWQRHIIDDEVGPAIQLSFVDDLYGDGKRKAIGSNHTNTRKNKPDPWESAIYVYDIPDDPRQPWKKTKISEGIVSRPGNFFALQAAPGIFGTGDLSGNGLTDILVSGDGDDRVFWLEQTESGSFSTHVLAEDFGQAGAMLVSDLDQDGNNEAIISSYEKNEVRILKAIR